MASRKHNGPKSQPVKGQLIVSQAVEVQDDEDHPLAIYQEPREPALQPKDFSTSRKVSAVMTGLLQQSEASEAAAPQPR